MARKEFSFSIGESAELLERMYRKHAMTKKFDKLVAKWAESKAPLIEALDKETARRVLPIEFNLPKAEIISRMQAAVNTTPLKYRGIIAEFYRILSHEEITTAKVTKSLIGRDYIVTGPAELKKNIRVGQKLTRAMSAWLKYSELLNPAPDEDTVAKVVSDFTDRWNRTGEKGWLVVSANLLDIATSSESCAWSSCHGLIGQYRSGPVEYICDIHTLICYYFQESREFTGGKTAEGKVWNLSGEVPLLPYKLWRQLVHVDNDKLAALFMRQYGRDVQEESHSKVRDVIGDLICKIAGKDIDKKEWAYSAKPSEQEHAASAIGRMGLAYPDNINSILRLNGNYPRIKMTSAVCPGCTRKLDNHSQLQCQKCTEDMPVCFNCREIQDDGDEVLTKILRHDGTSRLVCSGCKPHCTINCPCCNEIRARNEAGVAVLEEGKPAVIICRVCMNATMKQCHNCGEYKRKATWSRVNTLCQKCYDLMYFMCPGCNQVFGVGSRVAATKKCMPCTVKQREEEKQKKAAAAAEAEKRAAIEGGGKKKQDEGVPAWLISTTVTIHTSES